MNTIPFGGKEIDFKLVRSNREKTVGIDFDSEGQLTILAPRTLEDARIEEIIKKKARWIMGKKRQMEGLKHSDSSKDFVSGESFLYLGRRYRLKILKSSLKKEVGECRLIHGKLQVEISQGNNGNEPKEKIKEVLRGWYWRQASEKIKERVTHCSSQIGGRPTTVVVKDQKKRWGSCSKSGHIRLNWKLIMLPISLMDYLIVHELCHLIHPHHSPAFWQKVQAVSSDYKKKREELKEYSYLMDLL